MITEAQRKATRHWAVGSKHEATRTLGSMWDHRRAWWFARISGDAIAEAKYAAKTAMARAELMRRTSLARAQIDSWQREWDHWFEAWFRRFGKIT